MTSGSGDRTGEILPVRGLPRHHICERLAKGIWRLLQGSQAKLTVETYLVWLQSSNVQENYSQPAGSSWTDVRWSDRSIISEAGVS